MMRKCLSILAVAALAVVGISTAEAASLAEAQIPFEFRAATEWLPAGPYVVSDGSAGVLVLRNRDTGKSIMVPVVTRLAPREPEKSLFVFDVQEQKHYLSEIFAGAADGYAFAGSPGLHKHEAVTAKKPAE